MDRWIETKETEGEIFKVEIDVFQPNFMKLLSEWMIFELVFRIDMSVRCLGSISNVIRSLPHVTMLE